MNKFYRIIPLLLTAALLTACQPTPENSVVIYGRGLEERIARSSASLTAYDAPESWKETIDMKGSDATITFNASISVPDVTSFPVYKVVKAPFNNETIKPFLDYFANNRSAVKPTPATKSEITEQLVYAKKDGDEEWISELEKRYKDAPETAETEYITDWTLDSSEDIIRGFVALDGERYAGLTITANFCSYGYGFVFENRMLAANGKEEVGEVSILPEDAVKAAEEMLRKLGIDYMKAYSMQKAQLHNRIGISEFSDYSDAPSTKGYYITFVRNIDGVSGRAYEGETSHEKDDFAYTVPFYQEEMFVYVDEKGDVQAFSWYSPLKLTETVSKNASLMPFEDMKERIRDMLFFVFSYSKLSITVDNIEMRMTLVNLPDNADAAMYVPAWFIHCVQQGKAGRFERTIVLNAVDGGRVKESPESPNSQNG